MCAHTSQKVSAGEVDLPAICLTPYFNDIPQKYLTLYFHELSLTGFGRRGVRFRFERPKVQSLVRAQKIMKEYLDIVDENRAPTGERRLRSEVHSQGLWHRVVHVYLFRKIENDIEFLVHLRAKTKDLNPNKWDTRFGGHLKSGESVEDAVRNELKEEVGLELDPLHLIRGEAGKSDSYPNREFVYAHYYEFNGDASSLAFNDGEVQKVEWMKSPDIIKSMSENPDIWAGKREGFVKTQETLKSCLKRILT